MSSADLPATPSVTESNEGTTHVSSEGTTMILPTVIRSEIQYRSFVKIREDVLRLPDGSEYKYYVHATRARVAMVLAFTADDRVLVNVRGMLV
jgi:hypothetical protein